MMLVVLASLAAVAVSPTDAPDARNDIVDIRHGRTPTRHRLLGWTIEGAAVMRDIECDVNDGSGIPFCRATITVAPLRGRAKTHVLLDISWPEFKFGCTEACYPLAYRTALKFIRAEQRVLVALGPLAPAVKQTQPWHLGPLPLRLDRRGSRAALVTVRDCRRHTRCTRHRTGVVLPSGSTSRTLKPTTTGATSTSRFCRCPRCRRRRDHDPEASRTVVL
jgi:hypothetical protein